MKAIKHFKTITKHKFYVMKLCFRFGLYKQGLLHDLSKYTWSEFATGAKYYLGYKSPNSNERDTIGYSSAWLHHKGRNKHHWEYWIDFTSKGIIAIEMPIKQAPLDYYNKTRFYYVINEKTDAILKDMLKHLANSSLDETIEYIKKIYLS